MLKLFDWLYQRPIYHVLCLIILIPAIGLGIYEARHPAFFGIPYWVTPIVWFFVIIFMFEFVIAALMVYLYLVNRPQFYEMTKPEEEDGL